MAKKEKVTSPKVASKASKVLKSSSAGKRAKTAAGSVLSQVKAPNKKTSKAAAKSASKALSNKRTDKSVKSVAGSALSQRGKSGKTGGGKSPRGPVEVADTIRPPRPKKKS